MAILVFKINKQVFKLTISILSTTNIEKQIDNNNNCLSTSFVSPRRFLRVFCTVDCCLSFFLTSLHLGTRGSEALTAGPQGTDIFSHATHMTHPGIYTSELRFRAVREGTRPGGGFVRRARNRSSPSRI